MPQLARVMFSLPSYGRKANRFTVAIWHKLLGMAYRNLLPAASDVSSRLTDHSSMVPVSIPMANIALFSSPSLLPLRDAGANAIAVTAGLSLPPIDEREGSNLHTSFVSTEIESPPSPPAPSAASHIRQIFTAPSLAPVANNLAS